jgi:mRNA-degrading endonuclease RelE of RelBE toxin-antitoxin system
VTGPHTYTVVLSAAAKRADPYRVGKLLRFGLEGYWSARRGQYRVIYSIHDDEVLVRVVRISHRADVHG